MTEAAKHNPSELAMRVPGVTHGDVARLIDSAIAEHNQDAIRLANVVLASPMGYADAKVRSWMRQIEALAHKVKNGN